MLRVVGVAIILGVAGAATLFEGWHDGRIIGGQGVTIEEAPYQVSLELRGQGHTCGGAILSSRVVVTAAHCVRGYSAKSFQVRVGSSYVSSGGELLNVSQLVWHDKFSTRGMTNDIALLLLDEDLKFSKVAAPIEIYKEIGIEVGTITRVTGWGSNKEGGRISEQLQEVLVPTVARDVCSRAYKPYNITESMLCAGITDGGKDSCQGDSGGPMTYDGKLAGLVSWGIGCARPGIPGVYTHVAALKDWIEENIKHFNKTQVDGY